MIPNLNKGVHQQTLTLQRLHLIAAENCASADMRAFADDDQVADPRIAIERTHASRQPVLSMTILSLTNECT
jgi:hypothetical protein